jgi:hypothetical protein
MLQLAIRGIDGWQAGYHGFSAPTTMRKSMKTPTCTTAAELAKLAARIRSSRTASEGAQAVGDLADGWAAIAQNCAGPTSSQIAAAFEVGITVGHVLDRGEADEVFWRRQLRSFKRSVKS